MALLWLKSKTWYSTANNLMAQGAEWIAQKRQAFVIGYGVTANIAASHPQDRGSSGFDSPYPNFFGSEMLAKFHFIVKYCS